MLSEYLAIYRRAFAFLLAMPLVAAVPLAVQLSQRLLARFGLLQPDQMRETVLIFAILNTLAMLVVMVSALRWWRFDGDGDRVRSIDFRVLWGVAAMMTIQLTDEYLFTTAGRLAAELAGGGHAIFAPVAVLLWLFVSVLFYPWYVALITDDHQLTFRESVRRIRPRWFHGFALVLGALLPLLAVGMLMRVLVSRLHYGSAGSLFAQGIGMMLVPALIIVTASAYLAIYRMAHAGNQPPD